MALQTSRKTSLDHSLYHSEAGKSLGQKFRGNSPGLPGKQKEVDAQASYSHSC